MTEVYVNRTRNLHIDESPSASPSPSPTSSQLEKPRVKIPKTSRGLSPVSPSAGCLKRGPAHEASHLRTRSPRHLPGRSSKSDLSRDHTPLDQRQVRPLQEQFRAFSLHGDRRGSGTQLTLSQSDKWLRQSEIIDGRLVTTTDSAILWRRMSKSHIWMNFHEWLSYIELLAQVRLESPSC